MPARDPELLDGSGPWPGLGVKACGTLIELGHLSRLITCSKVTCELLRTRQGESALWGHRGQHTWCCKVLFNMMKTWT